MDETVARLSGKMLTDVMTQKKNSKVLRETHFRLYATTHDCDLIVPSGISTSSAEARQPLFRPFFSNEVCNDLLASCSESKKLIIFLRTHKMQSLCQLLKKQPAKVGHRTLPVKHWKLFNSFTNIHFMNPTSTFENGMNWDAVIVEDSM